MEKMKEGKIEKWSGRSHRVHYSIQKEAMEEEEGESDKPA